MVRSLSIFLLSLAISLPLLSQEEAPSLGEVARKARESKVSENSGSSGQKVIDNDNFSAVLDQVEAARLSGKPVFSIDPSGDAFRMTSPDGTCSLSFDAKATSLISSSFVSSDLPQDDLVKLEGHAVIHDDVMEVSVHNGSPWELRELVIGVTVLQKLFKEEADLAEVKMATDPSWTGKTPDSTAILHLRGSVAAGATGTFTALLGADSSVSLNRNSDWHWALVSARGIPPAGSQAPQSAAALPSATSSELAIQAPSSPSSAIVSATAPASAPSR
jgi:hypothetical protein